jgi:hypothetical protein
MAEVLSCNQDGAATRLTCIGCGGGICPRCLVRTPVGLKCPACTGAGEAGSRRRVAPVAAALLVGAAALFGLLAAALVSRGGGGQPRVATASPTADPGTQPVMGQEAHEGGLGFVVTGFDCQPAQTDANGASRLPQGRFCFLALTVKNVGDGPESFSGRFQNLLDAQGRRYGPDDKATQAYPDNQVRDFLFEQINPGNEISGVLVYDLPRSIEAGQALLRRTPRSTGITIRLA